MKLATFMAACASAFLLAGQAAQASFHFMQIEQVIGGVNGDTTAQAIQLRMRSGFQNQVQQSRLRAHDATGANPILLATFSGPVSNFAAGARVLITSANFANYTSPALVTDSVMTNVIPASYLAAGSLTFEETSGFIYWRVSWGGAAYTGPTTGEFTNDSDGNFGKLTAAMQTSNLQAFKFQGAFSAGSTTNQTDYALSASPAKFNNNAGTEFTVVGCPTITVSPATLPDGVAGDAYSQNIGASGGVSPYTYAVTAGVLPSGLTLTTGGLLSGEPDLPGPANFTVTATAANNCTGQRAYSINITCPTVTVSPPTLPAGTVSVAYSQTITASGGNGPYDFAVALGTLPDGLSLSSGGELSGIPTTPGTSNFTIGATSAEECSGIQAYALTINGAGTADGDLNDDGSTDGLDVKHFVECATTGSTSGGTCPPGDFNNSGGVNADDVPGFIAALLAA